MGRKRNLHLFKERITLSNYDTSTKELLDAVNGGEGSLRKLLFDTEMPDEYSKHGKYKEGQHNQCSGLKGDRFTEKRLCKCMYYQSSNATTKCEQCDFKNRFDVVGKYKIVDYEVPAYYFGDGIGEIDLIIGDGEFRYATEIKPYKNNNETLLRMIAEIMTYTEGYPKGTYKKAIAFFEKNSENGESTVQQKEYEKENPLIRELLNKADITVFRFERIDEKRYEICKL